MFYLRRKSERNGGYTLTKHILTVIQRSDSDTRYQVRDLTYVNLRGCASSLKSIDRFIFWKNSVTLEP